MTYVITELCIGTKDTSCVEVCPVDCIHPTPVDPGFQTADMLFIDPEECIDCNLCVAECPAQAIFPEDDVPAQQRRFIALNAELAKVWPTITEKKDAPPDADAWNGKPDKADLLER